MSSLFNSLFPVAKAVDDIRDLTPLGEVITWKTDSVGDSHAIELGAPASFERASLCHRTQPFWMSPKAGGPELVIPPETQFLFLQMASDRFALVVPLIDDLFRCSLQTGENGQVELWAESGDTGAVGDKVTGLYVAEGDDPYRLVEEGARAVAEFLGRARLRREKPLPPFVDLFGWCTWDAFYKEVSQEKVREGLQSFRDGGVQPRYLVLDDGWQSYEMFPTGEGRLTGLAPNKKFGGDLSETVSMSREEFGIEQFLVWHAFTGYWGGLDAEAMPGYRTRRMKRKLSPSMEKTAPWLNQPWGAYVATIDPEDIARFFHDYHRLLRSQGVDGVKVDVQTQIETLAEGFGGRVKLMQRYREALEGAAQVHFQGNLINCMALSNDVIYQTAASSLTRSSDDFYPNKPKSHGRHLVANALVGVWFGQFIHPDWDMFQSAHPMGAFHAAGRAISGGPVYVSDKPGAHDFELLKKLVLPNGRVPRAKAVAIPTRDTLFQDPIEEPVALKVFNHNAANGVLGLFNCRYIEEAETQPSVETDFGPADVEGLEGEAFVVYTHMERRWRRMNRADREPLRLAPQGYEVVTVAPVWDGVAVIGAPDLFNSGGVIENLSRRGNRWECQLKSEGAILLIADREPASLEGGVVERYDRESGELVLQASQCDLVILW